jgi:hypothetical protein
VDDLDDAQPGNVDRVLRGAKVSELLVDRPTKFELVINLKGRQGDRTLLLRCMRRVLSGLYGPAVRCKRFLRPG